MLPRTLKLYLCAFIALILVQSRAAAAVMDWDGVYWGDGDLTNSYQADPSDPESGITVTVSSNNGANLVPYSGAPNPMTPAVGTFFQGGLPGIENTLTIAVDLANPNQSVTISISFASSGGASDVSFSLFDIDAGGGAQDQLSLIRALSIDGVTLIAPTITTSLNNLLIGTGIDQSVVGTGATASTGLTSGRGNVSISFGTNLIQSLTFTYGNTAAIPNPAYQHFGVHDISFTPVPEIDPAFVTVMCCSAAAGLMLHRRRRTKKSS